MVSTKRKVPDPVISENPLFVDMKCFLVPLGPLKGKTRRDILTRLLVEGGGSIVATPGEAAVIVSSHKVSPSTISSFIGNNVSGVVVDDSWISQSINVGKQLDCGPYSIDLGGGSALGGETVIESTLPNDASAPMSIEVRAEGRNESLAKIFDHLETMVRASPDKRDSFRAKAYRTAASAIRSHPIEIRTVEDAEKLRSEIGPRSLDKIKEYLETGRVGKEEFLQGDKSVLARSELMGIWGVGPSTANDLVAAGMDSVEKLRSSGLYLLNTNQRLGLQYYEDLLTKMPRSEVDEISRVLEDSIRNLFGEKTLEYVVCGSYRRGADLCSDADFVMSWMSESAALSPQETVESIARDLEAKGLLVAHFNQNSGNSAIFMGLLRLGPGRPVRRFDMKVWPRESLPFAILHFTGNADVNRRMRLLAKRRGLKLTDLGLRNAQGEVENLKTEEDIFHALDLEFIPPEKRTSSVELRKIGEAAELASNTDWGESTDMDT